jgi:hypothetical protein
MGDADPKNRRRSQRVMLQVAVLMRATLPDGRSAQVQAFTLAVNAHGGLLESPIKLAANQRILLINPRSGKEVAGRVVGVEGSASAMHEVAVEFDCRSPQFWPIAFPPEDWAIPEEAKHDRS